MADIRALARLRDRDIAREGLMVLEGRIVIEKALSCSIVPELLVCTQEQAPYWQTMPGVQDHLVIMSHDELCALVDFKFHRGVLALAHKPALGSLDGWLARIDTVRAGASEASVAFDAGCGTRPARLLVLWDVTDPSNLGALIRTAAALGSDAVALGPGCADPYYRKAIRASMGNVFALPILACALQDLLLLREAGWRICAAALTDRATDSAVLADALRDKVPRALVLGNEGYGLPPEVLEHSTEQVCIPMEKDVDSLNVAVAGGILMYQFFRQGF
ncbi:MAG: RNA methyltransferase [Rectinemataceae bacterium]